MELKLMQQMPALYSTLVLIVPLWNWNDCKVPLEEDKERSNRTFMELKW